MTAGILAGIVVTSFQHYLAAKAQQLPAQKLAKQLREDHDIPVRL